MNLTQEKCWLFNGYEVRLELWPGKVFIPTTTSETIASLIKVRPGETAIDLGCGSGLFSILMAKMDAGRVYALDLLPEACDLTRLNAEKNTLSDRIDCRQGFLFQPLGDITADLIVNDVSGVAEEIARSSGWFPETVPTGGLDGTDMVVEMFSTVRKHLNPDGRLLFPVLSLSNEKRILNAAQAAFREIRLVAARSLPLPPTITVKDSAFYKLMEAGLIRAHRKRTRWLWELRIFEAHHAAA